MANTITALFNLYKNARLQVEHLTAQLAKAERPESDAGASLSRASERAPEDEGLKCLLQCVSRREALKQHATRRWIMPHIRGADLPTPVVGHNYNMKEK